jgi:hypothetical protein
MYGDAGDAPLWRRLRRQRLLDPRRDLLPPGHVRDRIEARKHLGSLPLCRRLELRGPEIGKAHITFVSEVRLPDLSFSKIRALQLSLAEVRATKVDLVGQRGRVEAAVLQVGKAQPSPPQVEAFQA